MWGAPDEELRGGNLIRVTIANYLTLRALGNETLQVYIVYHLTPREAKLIIAMVQNTKRQPQAKEGGGAAAVRPLFVIVNEEVLQAKLLRLMAMVGEINDITLTMEEVHVKEQPYYIAKPLHDHELSAGDHLKPLKQAYFTSRALAGTYGPPALPLFCYGILTVEYREFHTRNIVSNNVVCRSILI